MRSERGRREATAWEGGRRLQERAREEAARSPSKERPPFIPPLREMTEMPRWGHGIYILLPLLFIPAVSIPDPTAQASPDLDRTDENASREMLRRPRVPEL